MWRHLARNLALLIAVPLGCCAAGWEPPDGRFPISGWVNPQPDGFQRMADAGFTLALAVEASALDAVHAAGMSAIAHAGWLSRRDQFEDLVRQVSGRQGVVGYFLQDEPGAGAFETLREKRQWLDERAPGALAYINLFPNYASAQQLGTGSYEEYLEQYLETVRPRMLSFDHYPLLQGGPPPDAFWSNLEVIRAAALGHGIPFWAFCRTSVWPPYPDPNEAMLRLEVFANLVYGAKGLCYFRYSGAEGIVDDAGEPTRHYPMVRRINAIVNAWGPTLLRLRSLGVYHAGHLPAGCRGLPTDGIVTAVSPAAHLVIGQFRHTCGDEYVMLMNPDWKVARSFRVQFAGPSAPAGAVIALEEVSRRDGQLFGPHHAADGLFELQIIAGGARLFRVVREGPAT